MDPFIEGQLWADFHNAYIAKMREVMVPQLGDRYIALIEVRVYVERQGEVQPTITRPDVTVVSSMTGGSHGGARPTVAPHLVPLAMPEEVREPYVTIRLRDNRDIVAVVELLSPSDKRGGSDGRRAYLDKRDAILQSPCHLAELDLLRAGERLPMAAALPVGDYYAIVSRASRRPVAEVWAWSLPEPMPGISVPLAGADPDLFLDLQAVFDEVYERAAYGRAVDYSLRPEPGLSIGEQTWMKGLLGR